MNREESSCINRVGIKDASWPISRTLSRDRMHVILGTIVSIFLSLSCSPDHANLRDSLGKWPIPVTFVSDAKGKF